MQTDKLWKVTAISLTSDAVKSGRCAHYRYHVEGVNTENGERFSWSVPSVDDSRYDLSSVVVPS